MKKFLLAILLIPALNFAQDKISTTEEEYKYLTEGYRIKEETGSDLKSGYTLQLIQEDKLKDFTFTYKLFNETATNKTKAISIVAVKAKDKKDKAIYLCLPLNNEELYKKFFESTESLGISMKTAFDLSMYQMVWKSIDKITNRPAKN